MRCSHKTGALEAEVTECHSGLSVLPVSQLRPCLYGPNS